MYVPAVVSSVTRRNAPSADFTFSAASEVSLLPMPSSRNAYPPWFSLLPFFTATSSVIVSSAAMVTASLKSSVPPASLTLVTASVSWSAAKLVCLPSLSTTTIAPSSANSSSVSLAFSMLTTPFTFQSPETVAVLLKVLSGAYF